MKPAIANLAVSDLEPVVAKELPKPTPSPVQATIGSEGQAKAFIYNHESGNNPAAKNSIGCFGLGQACDHGALEARCGTDYSCQDAYFEGYAKNRYGSWLKAYGFWLQNHWW